MYFLKKKAFREPLQQMLTDHDKVLLAYVGRTQTLCANILAPGPKGAKWLQKRWMFCNVYNGLVFLCHVTDRREIRANTSIEH